MSTRRCHVISKLQVMSMMSYFVVTLTLCIRSQLEFIGNGQRKQFIHKWDPNLEDPDSKILKFFRCKSVSGS